MTVYLLGHHTLKSIGRFGLDEMTKEWLCQTPNPSRIPIFYTLTKIVTAGKLTSIQQKHLTPNTPWALKLSRSKHKPLVWKRYIDDITIKL